jgi:hypothetical protein
VIGSAPQWRFRRGGLGYLVLPPVRMPWLPPPALIPYQDPVLMSGLLAGLRRL